MVDRKAISIDSFTADSMPGAPNGCSQALSENLFHVRLNLPAGSLNENRMITEIGMNRYSSTSPANTFSACQRTLRQNRLGGRAGAALSAGAAAVVSVVTVIRPSS